MNVDTYLNRLKTDLANVFSNAHLDNLVDDETIADYSTSRAAAIHLAQSYYLANYIGQSSPVALNNEQLGRANLADLSLGSSEPAVAKVAALLNIIQTFYQDKSEVEALNTVQSNVQVTANSLSAAFATKKDAILNAMGREVENNPASALSQSLRALGDYYNAAGVDAANPSDAVTLTAAVWASAAASKTNSYGHGWSIGYYAAKSVYSVYNVYWGLSFVKATSTTWTSLIAKVGWNVGPKLSTKVLNLAKMAWNSAKFWAVAAFIFTVVVIWGAYLLGDYGHPLQRNTAIARAIGDTVVAVLILFIGLIPFVGFLIVAVIALIDGIMALVCTIEGVEAGSETDRWVCGGISGAVSTAIASVIYDAYMPYKADNANRLNVVFNTPVLVQKTANNGFVAGNELLLSGTVSNTISLNDPKGVIVQTSYLKPGTTELDRERLKDIGKTSAFAYLLQTRPWAELHNELPLNSTTWAGDTAVYTISKTVVLQEGINITPQLYFSEGYNLANIECWGFIGAAEELTCEEDIELKGSNHNFMGDMFTFDVLPNSLDGFAAFGRSLGYQADADGDGLRSGAEDPDDTTWDADDDGLPDIWEARTAGFSPTDPDSDDDGLFDYWEAFYRTDPALPDSDGDGLADVAEFFHSNTRHPFKADPGNWTGGWAFVYDYNGSQPLQTWVSANPNSPDTDADTILDRIEQAYGYHPQLPSELNVLALDARTDQAAYAPSATINYTATVKNELHNRVAYGLMETEFPVDVVQQQQVISGLYPQVEKTLTGSLNAPNTSTTLTQSLVTRAGALIAPSAENEIFALPFDDAAGSTTFIDGASGRFNFSCTACPTANGSTASFNGSQKVTRPHDDAFNQTAFSVSTWVKPTARGGIIYEDLNDFKIEQISDGRILITVENSQFYSALPSNSPESAGFLKLNTWHYLVVTYSGGLITLYNNGAKVKGAGSGQLGNITFSNNELEIGSGFSGEIDRLALHNHALTQDDVLREFNGLTMNVSFEHGQNGCNYRDSLSQRKFNCITSLNRRYVWPDGSGLTTLYYDPRAVTAIGIVGKGMALQDTLDLAQFGSNDTERDNALYFEDFTAPVPLAGSTPGINDNAFSIAMWLHKKGAPYGNASKDYSILTMPDHYSPGTVDNRDGTQVKIYAKDTNGTHIEANVGGCVATLTNFNTYIPNIEFYAPGSEWHHFIVAYNGQDTLSLYKDGQLHSNHTCTTATNFKAAANFSVGWSDLNGDPYYLPEAYEGWIDELRFYNRAFTPGEAHALYSGTHAQFDFNGRTGQTFFDNDSPSGVTGSCTGASCPTSGLPSIENQGLYFDGGDQINLSATAHELGLNGKDFTLMAWMNGNGTIFGGQAVNDHPSFSMGLWGNALTMTLGQGRTLQRTSNFQANKWYHVAFQYRERNDQNAFIGRMAIYLDGDLFTSVDGMAPPNHVGAVWIGRQSNESTKFTGLLDSVVMAEYALSQDEIQDYMNRAPRLNLHLDEGLENVLQDVSSFVDDGSAGLTATCSAGQCPIAGSRGQMREAPIFDGDDMLTVPDHNALDLNHFTVGLWVKPLQQKNDWQPLLVKESADASARNYGLFIRPDSMKVQFSFDRNNCVFGQGVGVDSVGALHKDQWNQIMATFDGQQLVLYINGTPHGTTAYTGLPCLSNHPLKIGNEVNANTGFIGSIDEATVHQAVLSPEEVKALYDYQVSWYDTTVHQPLVIDAEPPNIDVGPSPVYVKQEAQLMSFKVYDTHSGLAWISAVVEDPQGNTTYPSIISDSDPLASRYFFTFEPDQPGSYTFRAGAQDGAGHRNFANKTIVVDDTPPTIQFDDFSYDANAKTLTLFGRISDDASGVDPDSLTVALLNALEEPISGPVKATITGDTWTVVYPMPRPLYGEHAMYASVQDQVGNRLSEQWFSAVIVDRVAPTGDIIIDTTILDGSPIITGTVNDVGFALSGQETIFHFEEPTGAAQFVDGSQQQLIATCVDPACPVAGQVGQRGSAASFDGVDDVLTLGAAPAISGTHAFAVSAWIKTSHSGSNQVILQQRDNPNISNGQHQVMLTAGGHLYWWTYGDDGFSWQLQTPQTINDGAWHHIAAVREADGTGRLYIDGREATAKTGTPRTLLPMTLFVGGDAPANAQYFNGLLDEVTLYNTALTAEEVFFLANPLNLLTTRPEVQVRGRSYAERNIGPNEGAWQTATTSGEANFSTWSLPLSGLNPGHHKIDLRVTDQNGNSRYIDAAWTGTIDATPPETIFVSTPPTTTANITATFAFTGTDPTSDITGFECQLDGAGFSTCTSPLMLTNLVLGSHTFAVRARDRAGNVDPTPAAHTWTIDPNAVNVAPTVDAGPDQTIALPASASLSGSVGDDGLPIPPGAVTVQWSQVSGPGVVAFSDATTTTTTANFPADGTYLLRLSADDGRLTASDTMTVAVTCGPAHWTVTNAVQLNGVIDCFNGITTPGSYTMSVTSDITYTAGITPINNGTPGVSLTIAGQGHTLDANHKGRVLFVSSGNVTIDSLTLANGDVTNHLSSNRGGGLRIDAQGTVTVTYSTLIGNRAADSGGIFVQGGKLVLSNSTVNHNHSIYTGGGLFLLGGEAEITDSLITNNSSDGDAGGIENAEGRLTITGSTISHNRANFSGGGIYSVRIVGDPTTVITITDSIITDNQARSGGGIYNTVKAGLKISNSTVSHNSATEVGGGLNIEAGQVMVTNSTFSNNAAVNQSGGAIYNAGGNLTLLYTTITTNTASSGAGLSSGTSAAVTKLSASIVAGNQGGEDIAPVGDGPDPFASGGYNLIGVVEAGVSAFAGTTDQVGVSAPGLGPLADNGGATPTHALLSGSPAINWVTAAPTIGVDQNSDQIGTSRPQGTAKDAGAYELVIGNSPPVVDAGSDMTITLLAEANLNATVSDDGLPLPPGEVTLQWAQVSGSGVVTFTDVATTTTTAAFSTNGIYVLRLTADDGALTASDEITVTVNSTPNLAPTITSPDSASVAENGTGAIDVQATDDSDSEGNGLTFSLSGGADQALFSIDASTGVVIFNSAPDFENPADADGDNAHEIQVTVTDSGGLIATQDITVSVTDVGETDVCEPGSYLANPSDTSCSLADPGYFVSSAGATEQTPCAAGTFSALAGATSCTEAAPGFFVPGEAASEATPCPLGSYSSESGVSACTLAEIGYYVDSEGSASPTQCPVGTTTAAEGSTDINTCIPTSNVFATCGGYDVIEVSPGVYEAPSFSGNLIVGTNGGDWINGTNGPDLILGLDGPDDIFGNNGNDVICGGKGKDYIEGQNGNDGLFGDNGADWLIGNNGNDTLWGGQGPDDLEGNNGQDTLHGEDGYDVLLGGNGSDDLFGENGPDDLYGNRGADNLNGGNGNDYCQGGPGKDSITECEGASSASAVIHPDDAELTDEEAVLRSNDGENGEDIVTKRIQDLFLPLVSTK